MPYFISDQTDCPAWAVVKDDGEVLACHETKQGAIDQMVAVSLAEDLEPGGEYSARSIEARAAVGTIKIGDYVRLSDRQQEKVGEVQDIVVQGSINVPGSAVEITGSFLDPALLIQIYEQVADGYRETSEFVAKPMSMVMWIQPLPESSETEEPDDLDDEDDSEDARDNSDEIRQVDLTPPAYMRAAARRGLQYYADGQGGDGLVQTTIREARAMAAGNVTAEKWVRIRAWIARHLVDLDAPAARPDSPDYPSAGVVAHLLWGSGPSKGAARRALAYAESVVSRIEQENSARTSARGAAMSKVEVRHTQAHFEVRDDSDGMTFEGYAAVWNSPSEPLPFVERIAPGAFARSIKRARNDIKLLWNHESGQVLGSTRAGTLKLVEDERGLKVIANLPPTTTGRDAAVLLKRGDIDSMSFGFSVPSGGDSWSADGAERTLNSVRLHEVSIVAFPAYTATAGTTSVRGIEEIAKRTAIDTDQLADAMLKLEEGAELTGDDANLLRTVIDELSPRVPAPTDEPVLDLGDSSMLELAKAKLKLLGGI